MNPLSDREVERYSRQMRLSQVGMDGQQLLREASVLIVGAGGLGAPAAMYLAASGVGRIGLVDFDRVDRSNLHRQVIYAEPDVGTSKVTAAASRLRAMNPDIEVNAYESAFDASNGQSLASQYDLVLDGTDVFQARYLINDACVLAKVPHVYASVSSFSGQLFVSSNNGPCYRCLFPEPPPTGLVPSCAEAGVLGVVPGTLGLLQATEALKLILGIGDSLEGRLLLVDLLSMRFQEIAIEKDPACAVCGESPSILSLDTTVDVYAKACTPHSTDMPDPSLSVRELKASIDSGETPFLLDVRSKDEHAFADIGGALIPLPELSNRWDELEAQKDNPIVVYCRSGGRSSVAVSMLRARGFDAVNLEGGILAWSDQIDPSVRSY